MRIKIFLVERNGAFRNRLKQLIESEPDMEVVGESGDGETALIQWQTIRPDMIIMDIRLPGIDGIQTSRMLLKRDPQARIVFLTLHDNSEYVAGALELGARGYILKNAADPILINAIRTVYQGKFYFIGEVSDVLVRKHLDLRKSRAAAAGEVTLSKREEQILRLIDNRLSNKEIAEVLRVSVRTIEAHRLNILRKFQAGNMEAVLARLDANIDPLSVEGPGEQPV